MNKVEQTANALASIWSGIWDQRTEKGELIISKEIEQAIDNVFKAVMIKRATTNRKGNGGRKKIDLDQIDYNWKFRIVSALANGKTKTAIAKELKISRRTLNERLKEIENESV